MAKIIDPDFLSQGTEIVFDTTARTIRLLKAGNLSDDGATLQAVYSFCKEEWKDDPDLIKLPFPMEAITEAKFDLINGWDWYKTTSETIELVRDGGWSLIGAGGAQQEAYFGFITLGLMNDPEVDNAYYQQEVGGGTTNTVYTGPVNEPVKVFGDATHGDFDYRSHFVAFLREQGKVYSQSSLAEQAVLDIDYTVYKLPLANALDPKVVATDNDIETDAPYTNMEISYLRGNGFTAWVSAAAYSIDDVVSDGGRWFRALTNHSGVATAPGADATNWEAFLGERQIGANYYPFNVIVNGVGAVAEQIYEFTQWSNRRNADINDDFYTETYGSVNGNTAPQLLSFLGDTLVTGTGVFVENFNANDTNRIEFRDVSGTTRLYPFVAAGTINFNANLVNDADAKYWMFFADPDGIPANGDEYGTTGAIIVDDNDGIPITGDISGQPSVSFTFDYDGNTQGGRTPAEPADIVLVAIGLETAQFVSLTGTITRNVGINFSLVSNLERNYSNPE